MSLLDPDSSVAMRYTRRSIAKDIYTQYVAKMSGVVVSGSVGEYEAVAKASFQLADIFLRVQEEQPPVFVDKGLSDGERR